MKTFVMIFIIITGLLIGIETGIFNLQNPETMDPSLGQITPNLMVTDVDETVAFYQDVLGFNVQDSVPREDGKLQWAMMGREKAVIMFQEQTNIAEEYPAFKNQSPGGTLVLFTVMEGLDTYFERVRQQADILKEPYTTFYGMKEFQIKDNNGYILTFAEPANQNGDQ